MSDMSGIPVRSVPTDVEAAKTYSYPYHQTLSKWLNHTILDRTVDNLTCQGQAFVVYLLNLFHSGLGV
jgi:hypothetical protein